MYPLAETLSYEEAVLPESEPLLPPGNTYQQSASLKTQLYTYSVRLYGRLLGSTPIDETKHGFSYLDLLRNFCDFQIFSVTH